MPNYADLDDVQPYAEAEAPEPTETPVPDGNYQCMIERFHDKRTQEGRRRMAWQLRILTGPHAQRVLFVGHNLESPKGLGYLKRDLATCGVTLNCWAELDSHLDELLDMVVAVTVRNKGDFTNCYINKRVQLPDGVTAADIMETPAGGSDAADDEAPF